MSPMVTAKEKYLFGHNGIFEPFYEIPRYQRQFAWTKDDAEALWNDLRSVVDRNRRPDEWIAKSARYEEHFLGQMVFQSEEGVERLQVVDGQQRLISSSLLIAAIANFIETIEIDSERKEIISDWCRGCLHTSTPSGREFRLEFKDGYQTYKDIVNPSDPFEAHVEDLKTKQRSRGGPVRAVDKRLIAVYLEFAEKLKAWTNKPHRGADALQFLADSIARTFVVVDIRVNDASTAYEVFETLNARGQPLKQADLIKNKLLREASRKAHSYLNNVTNAWESAVEPFQAEDTRVNVTDFLTMHLKFKTGNPSSFTARTAYREFAKAIGDIFTPKQYAEELRKASEGATPVIRNNTDYEETIEDEWFCSMHLETFGYKWAYAPLIALAAQGSHHTDNDFRLLLKLCHNFSVRRFMVGQDYSAGQYVKDMDDIALTVADHGVGDATKLMKKLSPDAEFTRDLTLYAPSENKWGFYIHYEIERHLGSGAGVIPNVRQANQHLEHIVPQDKKATGWRTMRQESRFDDKDFDTEIRRIGNLLILEGNHNRHASNHGWSKKQGIYAKSRLRQPSELDEFLDDGTWTYQSIEDRTRSIAKGEALKIWSLKP